MKKEESHKKYIESEYKRLFTNKESDESDKSDKPFYYFVMWNHDGLEGFKVFRNENDVSAGFIRNMTLRARFNTARDLHAYAFKSKKEVPEECITKSFLKKQAIKLY